MTKFIIGCMIVFILFLGVAVYFSCLLGPVRGVNTDDFSESVDLSSIRTKQNKAFSDRKKQLRQELEHTQTFINETGIGLVKIRHHIDIFLKGRHHYAPEFGPIQDEISTPSRFSLFQPSVASKKKADTSRKVLFSKQNEQLRMMKDSDATDFKPEKHIAAHDSVMEKINRFPLAVNRSLLVLNKLKPLASRSILQNGTWEQKDTVSITVIEKFVMKILQAITLLPRCMFISHPVQQMAGNQKMEVLFINVIKGWNQSQRYSLGNLSLIDDSPTIQFVQKFFMGPLRGFPSSAPVDRIASFGFLGNPFLVLRPSGGISRLEPSLFRLSRMGRFHSAGLTSSVRVARLGSHNVTFPGGFRRIDSLANQQDVPSNIERQRRMLKEDLKRQQETTRRMVEFKKNTLKF